MPLTELNRPTVRPRGGVTKVELIPAPLWAGTSAGGKVWAFREDHAQYSEQTTGDNPFVPLVRHTLEMELPATAESRAACRTLAELGADGFVAVVTLASGETITPGYSARFRTAFPLRPTKTASGSGRTPADFPNIALTLESIDADPAREI